MYKYTPEYCKNNKVAILVKTEKDIDGLKKLNCHGHLISLTLYEDGFYTIPSNNTWTHDKVYLIENNYELIEASEFIKNNNMEKISIEKLKTDKEYVVYLNSEKEWEKLNELCGFNVTIKYWGEYCYSPWDTTYSSLSSIKNPGIYKHNGKPSKIITINQIKEYMEKEIIGYKLVKPEYKKAVENIAIGYSVNNYMEITVFPNVINKLKEAGVLDLWFEPAYKEENQVKPGDYLYFIDATKSRTKLDYENINGFVVKVTDVRNDTYDTDCKWITIDNNLFGGGFRLGGNGWIFGKHVRFATPEEIEKATTKVVRMGGKNGFDLTIRNKKIYHNNEDITGYVQTICALYPKHDVKKIGGYDFHIKDIVLSKTGCENKETLLSEWLSLYEMIK